MQEVTGPLPYAPVITAESDMQFDQHILPEIGQRVAAWVEGCILCGSPGKALPWPSYGAACGSARNQGSRRSLASASERSRTRERARERKPPPPVTRPRIHGAPKGSCNCTGRSMFTEPLLAVRQFSCWIPTGVGSVLLVGPAPKLAREDRWEATRCPPRPARVTVIQSPVCAAPREA